MRKFLVGLIRIYQWCLRPLLGQNCRFSPSCSDYAVMALKKYGALKGAWMSLKRIAKCNPWYQEKKDDKR